MFSKIITIFSILTIGCYIANCNPCGDTSNFNLRFTKQVEDFIDTAKARAIYNGKYNVYVIHLLPVKDSTDFCYSISYISNDEELKYIQSRYYFQLKDEFIVLDDDSHFKDIVPVRPIDSISKKIIKSKLSNPERGYITGTHLGMIVCKQKADIKKQFYNNADLMPSSMYDSLPKGNIKIYNYNPFRED